MILLTVSSVESVDRTSFMEEAMRLVRMLVVMVSLGLVVACSPTDQGQRNEQSGVDTPKAVTSSDSAYSSPGDRVILMQKLSLPKMKGWAPTGVNDSDPSTDFIYDIEGCNGGIPFCPKLVVVSVEPGVDEAQSAAFGLACDSSVKLEPVKPVGTDKIGGVTANRYSRTLKECKNIDFSHPDIRDKFDPNSKITLWYVKIGSTYLQIGAYDGPKGTPKLDVEKLRSAFQRATWVN